MKRYEIVKISRDFLKSKKGSVRRVYYNPASSSSPKAFEGHHLKMFDVRGINEKDVFVMNSLLADYGVHWIAKRGKTYTLSGSVPVFNLYLSNGYRRNVEMLPPKKSSHEEMMEHQNDLEDHIEWAFKKYSIGSMKEYRKSLIKAASLIMTLLERIEK